MGGGCQIEEAKDAGGKKRNSEENELKNGEKRETERKEQCGSRYDSLYR